MNFIVNLLVLILLCCPTFVFAELPQEVQDDFAVVDGYIVMPLNDEFIVDLDSRNNLRVGDILTLVNNGGKILHPVSREVVGSVVEPLGFLQVTRILSGYSYAKVLTPGLEPANGDPLKRFEQVPARLVADTGADSEMARQITTNLPQFDWLAEEEVERALLTFSLQGESLDISNAQGESLYKYNITDEQQLVNAAARASGPAMAAPVKTKPKLLQQLADSVMGAVGQTNEKRFAEMDEAIIRQRQIDRDGIWLGPNLDGSPGALSVADLDGDGQLETAVVVDNRLVVARIFDGDFIEVAEVKIPSRLQVLTMDALDLDGNGRPELYLSALNGYAAASFVVEFTGESYEIVIKNVRWLMRAFAFPGQSGNSLFGQRKIEEDKIFYGDVFPVTRDGDQLVAGDSIDLPNWLNIFNFLPFLDDSKQLNYAYQTRGDYLKVVSAENVPLWESADYFGGSVNCFLGRKEFRDEVLMPFCMPHRIIQLPGNELLVAQNEGQRIASRLRLFKNSRLVALNWNGYSMLESWRTASQPGYLGDYAVADADNDGSPELVMVVRFQSKGIIDDARSSVVIYELE